MQFTVGESMALRMVQHQRGELAFAHGVAGGQPRCETPAFYVDAARIIGIAGQGFLDALFHRLDGVTLADRRPAAGTESVQNDVGIDEDAGPGHARQLNWASPATAKGSRKKSRSRPSCSESSTSSSG